MGVMEGRGLIYGTTAPQRRDFLSVCRGDLVSSSRSKLEIPALVGPFIHAFAKRLSPALVRQPRGAARNSGCPSVSSVCVFSF